MHNEDTPFFTLGGDTGLAGFNIPDWEKHYFLKNKQGAYVTVD